MLLPRARPLLKSPQLVIAVVVVLGMVSGQFVSWYLMYPAGVSTDTIDIYDPVETSLTPFPSHQQGASDRDTDSEAAVGVGTVSQLRMGNDAAVLLPPTQSTAVYSALLEQTSTTTANPANTDTVSPTNTAAAEVPTNQVASVVPQVPHSEMTSAGCSSCDLVPCGQCQQGCSNSLCSGNGGTSKNGCANNNDGRFPTSCDEPFAPHVAHSSVAARPPSVAQMLPSNEQQVLSGFQALYEKYKIHQRQRFLGTRFGQDPFDAIAIQEVLFDVKPDLIIETGSNSGGSSLYLSWLMETINPDCKIVTIEAQKGGIGYWHNHWKQATDPRQHPLFMKRVTAIEGFSTDPKVIQRIKQEFVDSAQTVFVLLDSDHGYNTVASELRIYSPFVTVGSYVLVEDTWIDEANRAASEFVASTSDFVCDRQREHLVFSQHMGGYLKRVPSGIFG